MAPCAEAALERERRRPDEKSPAEPPPTLRMARTIIFQDFSLMACLSLLSHLLDKLIQPHSPVTPEPHPRFHPCGGPLMPTTLSGWTRFGHDLQAHANQALILAPDEEGGLSITWLPIVGRHPRHNRSRRPVIPGKPTSRGSWMLSVCARVASTPTLRRWPRWIKEAPWTKVVCLARLKSR